MAGSSKRTRLRRRWFLTLSLVAVIAVIAVGMLLWQAVGLSSFSVVSERVEHAKPLLGGLRLALIGLLALLWPRLPSLWPNADAENETVRTRWLALRWRVIGWLLVIELVLGQKLIGRFFAATTGPIA